MSFVVDASVLVAAVADASEEGRWAEELLGTGPLLAPDLVLVEATNILRRLERAGSLTRLEAGAAAADLSSIELELIPFAPCAARIWELRHNLTSYDAWCVAGAEMFGLPLATLDRPLSRASGPRCRFHVPDVE